MIRWHPPPPSRGRPLWMRIFYSRPLLALLLIFLVSCLWKNKLYNFVPWPGLTSSRAIDDGSGPYWHLLVPATSTNSRLCKTLLTSLIHNYPPPTLINWGLNSNDLNGYDPTTGKIWGVLKFLEGLEPTHDNDMVLMIDGHDVWFQLRPEVLMERYHAVNEAANKRLKRQFGTELIQQHGIYQTIIFGAEKFCWPQFHNMAHCYAAPESILPRDAYGVNTDHGDRNNRPRWLNSGTIMGPAGDMRKLFRHVHRLWLQEPNNPGMDQYYFGEVFGRQEFQRHSIRNSSEWIHAFEWYEPQDLVIPEMPSDGEVEFHIGVDYSSTLFQALHASQGDVDFVRHNDLSDSFEGQDKFSGTLKRKVGITTDIAASRPPVIASNSRVRKNVIVSGSELPESNITNRPWGDLPLGTNSYSGAIPVAVHHNGDKSALETMWKQMWFLPSAKEVLQRNSVVQEGPVVSRSKRGDGRSWWSMRGGKRGGWSDFGVWLSWESLCSEHEEEIFQN